MFFPPTPPSSQLASIAGMIALAGIGIIAYSKSDRMDVKLPVLG